jgi:hypothetical protein
MKSIQLNSHIGQDGLLQVQLPDCQNEDVEVLIVYQPIHNVPQRQWSRGFLESAGAWRGEPLSRASQPQPSERKPLL